ncbi:MAG TPA: DUF58 domain-containing protein [Bacteroidetes bacterium]|nr:DUF58 domain-containing protein [Bacteroidota bacterium]
MKKFFKSLYLTNRLWALLAGNILLFIAAHFLPALYTFSIGAFFAATGVLLLDIAVLFRVQKGLFAHRTLAEKLSNGDENEIEINLVNYYNFPIQVQVIDEVPIQFQRRDILFQTKVNPANETMLRYTLRPTRRGEYHFGSLNVYAATPIGLARRRFNFDQGKTVPVFPSFLQMRKYELMAISNRLTEVGVKKIRRLGHSTEFEQIRDYVVGDDYRTVNWKATARTGRYMVNQYIEERSQPIYCIIDKGRVMKMPFAGLSLLDYAINSTLVISNIAIYKSDRAGLITFSEKMGILLKADRKTTQMTAITDLLYKQKTRYLESNFEVLYANIHRKISQRSLLLLFTNFESLSAMRRQLPYLRRINRDHLLVVIFFENTELKTLALPPQIQKVIHQAKGHEDAQTKMLAVTISSNVEQIYLRTIAEKFISEKRQIVRELHLHGIQAILTAPENLTVDTLNKYLELKARGMI